MPAPPSVPLPLREILGQPLFPQIADSVVQSAEIRFFASCVEDGSEEYWRDEAGIVAPPALLSAWNRPLMWYPEGAGPKEQAGLALHFLVKEKLDLPYGVVTGLETVVHAAIRPGMRVRSTQTLTEIGDARTNRLGTGRHWTIRVEYRDAGGNALLGREDLRFFGYRKAPA